MQFGVLGPLAVTTDDGRPVDLGSPKLRALLTLLLSDPGRPVGVDRINDTLWAGEPPASATGTLQSYVSQLRRLLEPDRAPREPAHVLLTRPPGYLVVAGPESLDVLRFEDRLGEGERLLAAGDPAGADAALLAALALWRGEPYAELGDADQAGAAVQADRVRLAELRTVALERHVEAMLAAGRADAAVAELERLVAVHPLRERLWHSLILALYRTGRQADALRAFAECRRHLRDELGIDPGPRLQDLERAVLVQDPDLDLRAPPPRAAPRPEPAPPPVPLPPPTTGPGFVGRAAELAILDDRLRAAAAGSGSVVLVVGEAGIGKTRLTEETAARAGAYGLAVVWSRCADESALSALRPWTNVLHTLGAEPLPGPGPADRADSADSADSDAGRVALFEQIAEALAGAAAVRPLLVVLDDLHGADPASLHLLRFLVGRIAQLPLLVVATLRDGPEERTDALVHTLAELARERTVTRLPLAGLGRDEVAELLGDRGRDYPALVTELRRRTEGNPFFLVELIALLRSERRLDADGRAAVADVPASVRDVLERRLVRLPPDTRALLTLASVIGREFPLDVLEAAAELDAERIDTLIEAAVLSGLVVEADEGWAWRFSHDLVRETIVAGLTRLQRARLHRQIARGIAALPPRPRRERLDALAHHTYLAGPFAEEGAAVRYALAAAAAARERFAFDTAAAHTERALELDDDDADTRHLRREMLVALARDRRATGDLTAAQATLIEAIRLARDLGDPDGAAEAASVFGGVALWPWRDYPTRDDEVVGLLEQTLASTTTPRRRAALLGTLACEHCYAEDRHDALGYAREAVAIARELGDVPLLGQALNNLYLAGWRSAHSAECRAAVDESLTLVGRGLPVHTEAVARLHRAAMALRIAEMDVARTDLDRAGRLAVEVGLAELRAQVSLQEAGHATLTGAWERAEERAEHAFELQRRTKLWGARWCRTVQRMTIAWGRGRLDEVVGDLVDDACGEFAGLRPLAVLALAENGEEAAARRLLDRTSRAVPDDWSTDFLCCVWGEVAAALGTPDPAAVYEELLPRAAQLVVAGTANACWGSVQGVLGRLALRTSDHSAARKHLEEAVAVDGAVGALPWQARALGSLDELDALA